MVFEIFFFDQNGAKIILNVIHDTNMVFYYRIQDCGPGVQNFEKNAVNF